MTRDDHKTVPDKVPAPSPLDDLEPPSPDVADAQRKGFAAHVSVQKGFHQAADELAGPASGTGAEGPAIGAPTQLAKPVVSTKPGLGPAAAPADGLALSLGEADEPAARRQTRRLDTATLEAPRPEHDTKPRRAWLFAILALAAAVLLLVFLLPREPDTEQAASPSASPSTPGASAASVAATASSLTAPAVSAEPDASAASPRVSTASAEPTGRPSEKASANPKRSDPTPSAVPATAASVPTATPPPTPSSDLIFDMDKKQ